MKRTSLVRHITVQSIEESSLFQCGDTGLIRARSSSSAISRTPPSVQLGEDMGVETAWTKSAPEMAADESVTMNVHNEAAILTVKQVRVLGLSEAAVFQVGTNIRIELASFLRKVRDLRPVQDKP